MITPFRDKLLRFTTEFKEETKSSTVICERLSFDLHSRHLSSAGTLVLENLPTCHSSGEWEIWANAVVLDHASGIYKPFILLGQSHVKSAYISGSKNLMYFGHVNKNQIVITNCFRFPDHVLTNPCKGFLENKDAICVTIIDGPYVCVIIDSCIYVSPPSLHQSDNSVPLCYVDLDQSITGFICSKFRYLWTQCLQQNLILMLGTVLTDGIDQMETDQCDRLNNLSSRTVAFFLTFEKQSEYDGPCLMCILFDASCFISDVCSSVIAAVKVINCYPECCLAEVQKEKLIEQVTKCRVKSCINHLYCCTSSNQAMEWNNGQLLKWTNIPFGNGNRIQTCNSSTGDVYIIIMSANGNVCVINATSFQVCHNLEGIRYAFVGDFWGSCCEQAMFIKDFETEFPPKQRKNIILTDFSSCHLNFPGTEEYVSSTGDASDGSSDGLESAVQALEARLQTGLSYLQEVERKLDLKLSLSAQTIMSIRNMTLDQRSPDLMACKPGLIPLVSGEKAKLQDSLPSAEVPDPLEHLNSQEGNRVVVCGDIWWLVVENQIVIGAVIHNTAQRLMKDIKLLPSPGDIMSQWIPRESKSILLGANLTNITQMSVEDTVLEPILKKARIQPQTMDKSPGIKLSTLRPNQTGTIAMVIDFPTFTRIDGHAVNLLLCWVWGPQVNMDQAEFGHNEKNFKEKIDITRVMRRAVEHLGQISVCAKDILSGSHRLDLESYSATLSDTWQSYVALEAHQESYILEVKSVCSSLCQKFQQLLKDSLRFDYNESLSCHICLPPSHPLYLCRVEIQSVRQNNIHLATHARDEKQLLLLVNALYDALPDDVIILSGNQDNEVESLENALQAIQKETAVGGRSLRTMIEDPKNRNEVSDCNKVTSKEGDTGDRTNIKSVRDDFQARKRDLLAGSHTNHVSGKAYRDLVDNLIQLSLHTDKQIQVLERACVKQGT